ncbi:VWA domain-containing protein [Cyanobacterium stanieri LEGE 03274]|uniref:VWA domain-containing protein n=1 Tax=Cyanobacterium stanieri LEGE 03274 TaxID=1828756 RepID=A0ABR9V677_9CHRO|nr:VWA domain-containing protein [Cyanobacterium stanieri]MBE9222621.1 VWA domain-containing protein [Cyanobacterium stanieri LEGE 03274]
MPVGLPEFADNTENRCPVILLLDTSASMSGEPIRQLNMGISDFKGNLLEDTQATLSVELSIITFGQIVNVIQNFTSVDEFTPPTLQTSGTTPMGEAINSALDLLEERKMIYKDNGIPYYRPWIFLITDGAPTDDWQMAAQRLHQKDAEGGCLFFAVGVEGADMNTLTQIAPPNRPPALLSGLNFRELFVWLSSSMKRVSGGKVGEAIALPPVGWAQIST